MPCPFGSFLSKVVVFGLLIVGSSKGIEKALKFVRASRLNLINDLLGKIIPKDESRVNALHQALTLPG